MVYKQIGPEQFLFVESGSALRTESGSVGSIPGGAGVQR